MHDHPPLNFIPDPILSSDYGRLGGSHDCARVSASLVNIMVRCSIGRLHEPKVPNVNGYTCENNVVETIQCRSSGPHY